MGTRADFYVGRGEAAEWLGSIAMDGYPDGHPEGCMAANTEEKYRTEVECILGAVEHATRPDEGVAVAVGGQSDDYAYAFDGGKVWASCFGGPWQIASDWKDDGDEAVKVAVFPNMKDRQNVTFGPRSGILILGR